MATNDIGRVTPIWRGFYSAATTYELNDIVIDTAGSVWWHKSEEQTTGVIPEAGEIWDAVIDMSVFSALIQAAITTAQTAVQAAQEAESEVAEDVRRAETAAQSAEASAEAASESAAGVGALAQAAEQSKTDAQTAATQAAASASSAGASATSAGSSAQTAEAAKTAAQTAATQAAGSAETASGAAAVVEQKKAEAIAAIETKGEEVLESIPEDYTELSGDVGDLQTQIIPYVGENVAENMLRIEPPGLGKNLFNKYSLFNLYGVYHNRNNGLNIVSTMMETHYIPVIESENYAFTHTIGGFVLWYKKDLSFLSYSDFTASDAYVTAPSNAAFMKMAFSILNVNGIPNADKMQVENGTSQTSYEGFIKNTSKYKAELIQEGYGIINISNSELLETDNLFDINADNILTGYYNRANNFVSSSTLGQSDYIEVFEGYEYSFASAGTFVLWYDGRKNYITYTNITDTAQKVTVPARAKYVRGIIVLANIDSYWVKCEKIKRIKANYPNPFMGLKGVAFGTSLTYRAETTGGYLQYLPGLSEMAWDNQGLGSATILDNGTQPKMLPVITGYTNWSDKKICILEGFVNDWYYNGAELGTWKDTGTTTVCGCVRYALNYILTQNANLTVYLVMDHFGKGITATTAVNGAGDTQLEFYEEIEKVALSLGIRVIREYEISEISELTPQFLLDNIHLNDLGAKQSAKAIWSGMKKYYPNEES